MAALTRSEHTTYCLMRGTANSAGSSSPDSRVNVTMELIPTRRRIVSGNVRAMTPSGPGQAEAPASMGAQSGRRVLAATAERR